MKLQVIDGDAFIMTMLAVVVYDVLLALLMSGAYNRHTDASAGSCLMML